MIISIRAMQQDVGIVLLCSSKHPNDVIPVAKRVEVHKSLEFYFILLCTCVGWCIDYKNLHSKSKIKSEGRGFVKRSRRKWVQIIQTDLRKIGWECVNRFYVAVLQGYWLRILEILTKFQVLIPKRIH